MTARKVYGRGKKKISFNMIEDIIEDAADAPPRLAEAMSEAHRLLAKRLIILIVGDDEVEEVTKIIVEKNQTGSMGDGKIFVLPIYDVIRVRTGESGQSAV
jgi:nitrogen regulatory protein PII 2